MRKLIIILTAIASLTIANYAQTPDDKTFFSGAHLGMTIDECVAYYRKIADGGILRHSGAPRGEEQVDFRTASVPQRRVYVYFRKSDKKIVSVTYWKLGPNETFSQDEIHFLTDLNSGHGKLTTSISDEYKADSGTEFEVTTAKQYRLEQSQN